MNFSTHFEEREAIIAEIREHEQMMLAGTHFGDTFIENYNAGQAANSELHRARAEAKAKRKENEKPYVFKAPKPPGWVRGMSDLALWHEEIEDTKKIIELSRESRKKEYEIICNNYTFTFDGGIIAGKYYEAFKEVGLRSKKSAVIKRFVQATRKRGSIEAGIRKDYIYSRRSKLMALYQPYVRMNTKVIQAFRIDIDKHFQNEFWLRHDLTKYLPVMPDLVVFRKGCGDEIVRPHLWFFLPIGQGVWNDPDDPRCRQAPLKLLRGVVQAIVKALIPLGADPGGLTNMHHGKNPCSPFWNVLELNDERNLSLKEWAEHLNITRGTRKSDELMTRESAIVVSELSPEISNAVFNHARSWSIDIMREKHRSGGAAYDAMLKDRSQIADFVRSHLHARLHSSGLDVDIRKACRVLDRVADYQARHWNPERASKSEKVHGKMGQLTGTAEERMSAGGAYGGKRKGEAYRDRIINAAIEMHADGVKITKSSLARRAGVKRDTVAKHFDAALDALSQNCPNRVHC